MTALISRYGKGSALTYGEHDANIKEIERRTGSGWNDLVTEVTLKAGAASPGVDVFRGGIIAYTFPADTVAECFANFHFRHDYVWGTEVFPHLHWSVTSTNTGTVRWGVEWTYAQRQDGSTGVINFPATQTIYMEMAVAAGGQYRHFVTEPTDGNGIQHPDLMTDGLILARFFRDATHPNDTFPDPVFLLTVDVHYQSDVAQTPSRFPPFY